MKNLSAEIVQLPIVIGGGFEIRFSNPHLKAYKGKGSIEAEAWESLAQKIGRELLSRIMATQSEGGGSEFGRSSVYGMLTISSTDKIGDDVDISKSSTVPAPWNTL